MTKAGLGWIGALALLGCSSFGGGSGSSSAAAGDTKATCDDAARKYGEHVAKMMEGDPKNPLPVDKRKLVSAPIRDATVASCKEEKWDDLPLSCLAAVFNNPPKELDKLDEYTDVCIKSVGKEKLDKMDHRVAQAMADAVRGPAASASAAATPSDSAATSATPTANGAATTGGTPAPTTTPPPKHVPDKTPGAPHPTPKPPKGDDL